MKQVVEDTLLYVVKETTLGKFSYILISVKAFTTVSLKFNYCVPKNYMEENFCPHFFLIITGKI